MKIQFHIDYYTASEEHLFLCVTSVQHAGCYAMNTEDGKNWTCELVLNEAVAPCIDYYYEVHKGDETTRQEWQIAPHKLDLAALKGECYVVFDHWIDIPDDAYHYTSAFTECVAARVKESLPATSFERTISLKVRAPQLQQDESLAIVGAPEYLGAWDAKRALLMAEHAVNEWTVSLDADRLPGIFEFKFLRVKWSDTGKRVSPLSMIGDAASTVWELHQNRFVDLPELKKGDVVVLELPATQFDAYPWKGAGTVIPVFSLRSEGSFGVGDFGDLKLMVDWCAQTRQRVLQILPINDTNMTGSWQDSYPYNSISIYALHPQYTDLRQLPPISDEAERQRFEQLREELNALPQIDYERMFRAKIDYLRIIYKQDYARLRRTKAFKTFVEQNRDWLEPYARFCVNRDKYGTAVFAEWPKESIEPKAEDDEQMGFWYFVQYHLDAQMRAAHEHARSKGVILKGDIPIGISRDGVEAWVEPRYFNLNGQAGAPPDAFAEDGQNWGFPTYNWDEMLKDGCQWWVRRFRKIAQYFDAYRIDHVLGFFRIWEIPVPHKSGLYGQFQPSLALTRQEIEQSWHLPFREELYLEDHKHKDTWHPRINATRLETFSQLPGDEQNRFWDMYNDYFYRRQNQFWYEEAMKKLPRLTQATRMLCCAEDLGMVPDCVPWVLNQLKILSLEIQSMPKETGLRFGQLSRNPYRSVATISTHDMATLRQWWDEDPSRTQAYYGERLYRSGEAPHPLPGWLAKDIVSRHLTSPSMLCLLSLQDWLSIDEQLRLPDADAERINVPANSRHYWRYRMHLSIEQLMAADGFNATLTELIGSSGR